jgi:hypothetical protein
VGSSPTAPTLDRYRFSVYNRNIQCLNSWYLLHYFVSFTLSMVIKMDEDDLDISEMWWYDDDLDCYVGDDYDEDYDYEEVN